MGGEDIILDAIPVRQFSPLREEVNSYRNSHRVSVAALGCSLEGQHKKNSLEAL